MAHRFTPFAIARALLHLALFAAALALYTATLHPDVQPADSGEFQIAAITLGIPHPPGYPLYTMLGWLFAQAPVGSPFARVSFLSAVASAGALALLSLAASRIAAGANLPRAVPSTALGFARACAAECGPGLLAALALAVSTTFWAQATTANIRSLTAFFAALITWLAARAWAEPRPAALAWFAAALGLGIGHHASLAFPGGVLAIGVAVAALRARLPVRAILAAGLAFAATQLVWLYLPLRDAAGARFAPGGLTTLDGLLYHMAARGFAGDMFAFATPEHLADRLALLPTLLSFQFSLPVLMLAAAGAAVLMLRRPFAGAWLLAAFGLHLFVTLTYRAPQTVEYALPAWVILCLVLGCGWGGLATGQGGAAGAPGLRRRALARLAAVAALLLAAFCSVRDGLERLPSYQALAADRGARRLAEGVLKAANPGAIVWSQWHQATPLWALQDVEGLRRDVTVGYAAPQGAQPYADTFADRVAGSPVSGVYATSLFALQFSARGACAVPMPRLDAWEILPCAASAAPQAARLTFDGRIEVASLEPEAASVGLGQALRVIVAWRAAGPIAEGDSLTVRMLRPDGRLAANADLRLDPAMRAGEARSRRVALGVPLNLPPGDYELLVGAYHADASGFTALTERGGAEYAALAAVRVTAARAPPATRRPMNGSGTGAGAPGPVLVGVDYDTGIPGQLRLLTHWRLSASAATLAVESAEGQSLAPAQALPQASQTAAAEYATAIFDVPPWLRLQLVVALDGQGAARISLPDFVAGERYVAFADQMVLTGASAWRDGGRLVVDLAWLSARAITTDYVMSARVSGPGYFAVHDGVPALGAIPTLKWIRGSAVVDRHSLALPEQPGGLAATVLVYDAVTQQELPALDERHEQGITVWRSE